MGPIRATSTCLRKYFQRSGRASRSEYWWFMAMSALFSIFALLADFIWFGPLPQVRPVEMTVTLLLIIPTFTVAIRRLHDISKSGLYYIYPVIGMVLAIGFGAVFGPYIGPPASIIVGLIMILFILHYLIWFFLPSHPNANKYGPSPHEVVQ